MFPKMVEIFKSKGDYFIVYERPTGGSMAELSGGRMELGDFYVLFEDLCQFVE